ncbi:MAG: hypothetical protein QXW71_00610 [Thermoplasmata archaeon]
MSIYVEQGQATNDKHLLSLLKNFLNYNGWEDISVNPTNFTVSKVINNFRWYWYFDVGFPRNYNVTTFGLDYGYGTSPDTFYKARMNYETLFTWKDSALNYFFIYNTKPPGDNLILVIYQNDVFLTGYIGFINVLIYKQDFLQRHHICTACYSSYSFNTYSLLVASADRGQPYDFEHLFYYSNTHPAVRSVVGGIYRRDWKLIKFFNHNQILPSLISDIPLLQPLPVYILINNHWSYIGYLKDIYTCHYLGNKPTIDSFGTQNYLFVPILSNSSPIYIGSYGIGRYQTIYPYHSFAILTGEG